MRAEGLARKPASAGVRTTMGLIADQVIARATRPEHNRTSPATATARKLLEANSSRMVHHLSCAPLLRTERPSLCTVKAFSTPADGFGAGWCFRATPIGASIGGTARLVRARRARHASMRTLIGREDSDARETKNKPCRKSPERATTESVESVSPQFFGIDR
jgi:hypothetical protein